MLNLASFLTSLDFEWHAFENAAWYLMSETNLKLGHDHNVSSASLVQFGPRTPEIYSGVWDPVKIWRRKCAKSWITLPRIVRFRSNFTQGLDTRCLKYHKSSRSRGQRSRSQRDVKLICQICQTVNNSARECSISIKFSTDYDHVQPDLPQTFKVNGSKSRS